MAYLVEQYREGNEKLLKKLYEAKMAICEAIEAMEDEEMEYAERKNYRRRNGRYNY